MPRRPDPGIEDRILNAALTLFRQGGEKALTMRGVARAAGTNTPTVYRRFKNRRDILSALAEQVRQELVRTLEATRTPREACVKYVEFARVHPYEFRLSRMSQAIRSRKRSESSISPMVELLGKQLAERIIGSETERQQLALSLWALAHGTATLLLPQTLSKPVSQKLHAAFVTAVDTLLGKAKNARASN